MAINFATLAKQVDGVVEYIYPKTAACLVEYTNNQTVEEKLNELDTRLSSINIDEKLTSYFTKSEVADLVYRPIRLIGCNISPAIVEIGSVQAVTVTWKTDKKPKALTLDGVAMTPNAASGSQVFTNIRVDRTFTLSATDEGSPNNVPFTDTKTVLPPVYYGVASVPTQYNSQFVLSLAGKGVQPVPDCRFAAKTDTGSYVFFACPASYKPIFCVNGIFGGFEVVATINFTNAYGYTSSYNIYKTIEDNLNIIDVWVLSESGNTTPVSLPAPGITPLPMPGPFVPMPGPGPFFGSFPPFGWALPPMPAGSSTSGCNCGCDTTNP